MHPVCLPSTWNLIHSRTSENIIYQMDKLIPGVRVLNQYNGQWRANCCFLRPFRTEKDSEIIQSDTLTSQGGNLKLREITDFPKVTRQVHEQARTVLGSPDGLHCAVLTFRASPKQTWWSHPQLQAQPSLEEARQQHRLRVGYTANHP